MHLPKLSNEFVLNYLLKKIISFNQISCHKIVTKTDILSSYKSQTKFNFNKQTNHHKNLKFFESTINYSSSHPEQKSSKQTLGEQILGILTS